MHFCLFHSHSIILHCPSATITLKFNKMGINENGDGRMQEKKLKIGINMYINFEVKLNWPYQRNWNKLCIPCWEGMTFLREWQWQMQYKGNIGGHRTNPMGGSSAMPGHSPSIDNFGLDCNLLNFSLKWIFREHLVWDLRIILNFCVDHGQSPITKCSENHKEKCENGDEKYWPGSGIAGHENGTLGLFEGIAGIGQCGCGNINVKANGNCPLLMG